MASLFDVHILLVLEWRCYCINGTYLNKGLVVDLPLSVFRVTKQVLMRNLPCSFYLVKQTLEMKCVSGRHLDRYLSCCLPVCRPEN